jgi:hypothetical protein
MPADIRVGRLRRAVKELLQAARRGECAPLGVELAALQAICLERGAVDAARRIRRYAQEQLQAQPASRGRRS